MSYPPERQQHRLPNDDEIVTTAKAMGKVTVIILLGKIRQWRRVDGGLIATSFFPQPLPSHIIIPKGVVGMLDEPGRKKQKADKLPSKRTKKLS